MKKKEVVRDILFSDGRTSMYLSQEEVDNITGKGKKNKPKKKPKKNEQQRHLYNYTKR